MAKALADAGNTTSGLVGRDDAVARLVGALRDGSPGLVVGPPGVGKTAVLDVVASAVDPDARRGSGIRPLDRHPYLALHQALRGLRATASPVAVVREVTASLGRHLLVVDDVHWCDHDTLDVLVDVAFRSPVLLAGRPGTVVADLTERFGAELVVVELNELDPTAATQIVRRLRPGAPEADTERWVREAGGNPLLLEAAVRTPARDTTEPVPLIALLVDELDPAATECLGRLALAGTALSFPAAETAALADRRLVDLLPDGRVRLRHDLFGTAALDRLDASTQRAIHRELAATATEPAEAAVHLAAAGDAAAAASEARRAAVDAPSPWSRAEFLDLAASQTTPADPVLVVEAAEALGRAGRYRDALARIGSLATTEVDLRSRAAVVRARAHWTETEIEEARAAIEDGLVLLAGTGTPGEIELLALRTRVLARIDWDLDAAVALGRTTDELATRAGTGEAAAASALGLALLMSGDPEWQPVLERAGRAARHDDDLHEAVAIYDTLLFAHLLSGEPARCRGMAEEMVCATEISSPAWNGYFRAAGLMAALHVSADYPAVLDEAPRLLARPLTIRSRGMASGALALALADTGDDPAAVDLATRAAAAAPDDTGRSMALWALAEAQWSGGDLSGAIETSDACVALSAAGFPGHVNAALVGQWARFESGAPLDPAARDATRSGFPNLGGAALEMDGLDASDPAEARRLFERAEAVWATASRRGALRARWGAGASAARAGDVDHAAALLGEVAREAHLLGMRPLERRARSGLRALGRPLRRGHAAAGIPSVQEEVLRRVAAGRTTGEIARSLSISPSTVETHVRNARRSTGARSRVQAAAVVLAAPLDPADRGRPAVVVCTDALALERFRTERGVAIGDTVGLRDLPEQPWALGDRYVVVDRVATRDAAARAVLAAARGAAVGVELATDDPLVRAELLDGLARVGVAVVEPSGPVLATGLTDDDSRLLELLTGDASVRDAARELGFSARTVHRRLRELQARFGVSSNREVVAAFRATR